MIHFASPLAQYRTHRDAIQSAIARVLESGTYILGAEVDAFERAFADFCGVTHAVGVGNGTDALILALRALDVGPGDEVVTVSHTAVATVAAVLATGATPVLVDVEPQFYTLDPTLIEEALTLRTKAILAVHLYGQAADMAPIMRVATARGLRVIEDCAQAAGSRYGGQRVGSIGDIGCFSFYPTKNLAAMGDGGMLVTSHADLAARVGRLRQYGWDNSRKTHEIGLNSRLDPLQAAILNAKLPRLETDNARRAAIAGHYQRSLAKLPLTLPGVRPHTGHAYHLYVVTCDDRDGLMSHLARHKIGSGIHYPLPVHRQKGYAERVRMPAGGLPVTDALVARILSLPLYPELSDADVDRIVGAVDGFFKDHRTAFQL